jgi:hypothetical protein
MDIIHEENIVFISVICPWIYSYPRIHGDPYRYSHVHRYGSSIPIVSNMKCQGKSIRANLKDRIEFLQPETKFTYGNGIYIIRDLLFYCSWLYNWINPTATTTGKLPEGLVVSVHCYEKDQGGISTPCQ